MKSAVFYGPYDIRIEDREIPKPGSMEVLIQVKACGVCGSDVHIYEGGKGSNDFPTPAITGHEYAGVIVEVGEDVIDFQVGDRVCVDPNMPCGKCYYCRQGDVHFCEDMIGFGTQRPGGYEEYSVVHVSSVYKIADTTTYEQAAMAEPLACCIHGMDMAGIIPGCDVVIIGGGMIGLLMLQLAKLSGARKVAMITRSADKQKMALNLGADVAIHPFTEDVLECLHKQGMHHIRTVIECVGKPQTIEQAVQLVGPKGTVVLFGVADPDAKIQLNPYDMFTKEVTIRTSFINPLTFRRAVQLIDDGRIDVSSMVADVLGLDRLVEVLTSPKLRAKGKYIINPKFS